MIQFGEIIVAITVLFAVLFGIVGFFNSVRDASKPTDPLFALLPVVIILAVIAFTLLSR